MNNLELIIPKITDLWFKKEIKEDPKTMDYNAGYDLSFKGYNKLDGTIKTDIKELENVWFKNWIGNEPSKFYYYIKLNEIFIGEIYAKYVDEKASYEIGIVIKSEFRGKSYATLAIKLLCEKLKQYGVKNLFHELPTSRVGAIKADLNNGFVVKKDNIDGIKKFGVVEKLTYLEKTL